MPPVPPHHELPRDHRREQPDSSSHSTHSRESSTSQRPAHSSYSDQKQPEEQTVGSSSQRRSSVGSQQPRPTYHYHDQPQPQHSPYSSSVASSAMTTATPSQQSRVSYPYQEQLQHPQHHPSASLSNPQQHRQHIMPTSVAVAMNGSPLAPQISPFVNNGLRISLPPIQTNINSQRLPHGTPSMTSFQPPYPQNLSSPSTRNEPFANPGLHYKYEAPSAPKSPNQSHAGQRQSQGDDHEAQLRNNSQQLQMMQHRRSHPDLHASIQHPPPPTHQSHHPQQSLPSQAQPLSSQSPEVQLQQTSHENSSSRLRQHPSDSVHHPPPAHHPHHHPHHPPVQNSHRLSHPSHEVSAPTPTGASNPPGGGVSQTHATAATAAAAAAAAAASHSPVASWSNINVRAIPIPPTVVTMSAQALAPVQALYEQAWTQTVNSVQQEMHKMHIGFTSLVEAERRRNEQSMKIIAQLKAENGLLKEEVERLKVESEGLKAQVGALMMGGGGRNKNVESEKMNGGDGLKENLAESIRRGREGSQSSNGEGPKLDGWPSPGGSEVGLSSRMMVESSQETVGPGFSGDVSTRMAALVREAHEQRHLRMQAEIKLGDAMKRLKTITDAAVGLSPDERVGGGGHSSHSRHGHAPPHRPHNYAHYPADSHHPTADRLSSSEPTAVGSPQSGYAHIKQERDTEVDLLRPSSKSAVLPSNSGSSESSQGSIVLGPIPTFLSLPPSSSSHHGPPPPVAFGAASQSPRFGTTTTTGAPYRSSPKQIGDGLALRQGSSPEQSRAVLSGGNDRRTSYPPAGLQQPHQQPRHRRGRSSPDVIASTGSTAGAVGPLTPVQQMTTSQNQLYHPQQNQHQHHPSSSSSSSSASASAYTSQANPYHHPLPPRPSSSSYAPPHLPPPPTPLGTSHVSPPPASNAASTNKRKSESRSVSRSHSRSGRRSESKDEQRQRQQQQQQRVGLPPVMSLSAPLREASSAPSGNSNPNVNQQHGRTTPPSRHQTIQGYQQQHFDRQQQQQQQQQHHPSTPISPPPRSAGRRDVDHDGMPGRSMLLATTTTTATGAPTATTGENGGINNAPTSASAHGNGNGHSNGNANNEGHVHRRKRSRVEYEGDNHGGGGNGGNNGNSGGGGGGGGGVDSEMGERPASRMRSNTHGRGDDREREMEGGKEQRQSHMLARGQTQTHGHGLGRGGYDHEVGGRAQGRWASPASVSRPSSQPGGVGGERARTVRQKEARLSSSSAAGEMDVVRADGEGKVGNDESEDRRTMRVGNGDSADRGGAGDRGGRGRSESVGGVEQSHEMGDVGGDGAVVGDHDRNQSPRQQSQSQESPQEASSSTDARRAPLLASATVNAKAPARSKIGINHMDLLYETKHERMVCRMCLTRDVTQFPPVWFPIGASWAELVGHCKGEHPKAWGDLEKLSPSQVAEMRQRLASGNAPRFATK